MGPDSPGCYVCHIEHRSEEPVYNCSGFRGRCTKKLIWQLCLHCLDLSKFKIPFSCVHWFGQQTSAHKFPNLSSTLYLSSNWFMQASSSREGRIFRSEKPLKFTVRSGVHACSWYLGDQTHFSALLCLSCLLRQATIYFQARETLCSEISLHRDVYVCKRIIHITYFM